MKPKLLILCCLALFSCMAFAEIYKWTDENGTVHFASKPPPQLKAEKVNVQVNSYTSAKR